MKRDQIPSRFKDCKISDVPELKTVSLDDSIFMHGTVGTGKTHALYALTNERLNKDLKADTVSFESLMRDIRASFGKNPRRVDTPDGSFFLTEQRIIEKFSRCAWFGVDDLGSTRQDAEASQYTLSVVYEIVNNRYADKLPMVVTSNKSLDGLAREFDGRIVSRLAGMCKVITFRGSDRRITVAKNA